MKEEFSQDYVKLGFHRERVERSIVRLPFEAKSFYRYSVRLDEDFHYECDGKNYVVKKGYEFDGQSVPKCLKSFVGGNYRSKTLIAALIHDDLLFNQSVSKKVAHERFYRELKKNKVRFALLYYWAVYIYGKVT